MEHLFTVKEALILIALGILALYYIASVKSNTPVVEFEREEAKEETQPYLERYGAVIQQQQYH